MVSHIREIFDTKGSEIGHRKLMRFGKGAYDREEFIVKFQGKAISLQGGFEFAESFLLTLTETDEGPYSIKGRLISKKGIPKVFDKYNLEVTKEDSKFTKVEFKGDIDKNTFLQFYEDVKSRLLLVNIKGGKAELKMGSSPPKPGSLKEKFCTLKVPKEFESNIMNNYLFDMEGKGKKVIVRSTYTINDFIIPKEYENDPALAREHALRVGKIKRLFEVDGNQTNTSEFDMEV